MNRPELLGTFKSLVDQRFHIREGVRMRHTHTKRKSQRLGKGYMLQPESAEEKESVVNWHEVRCHNRDGENTQVTECGEDVSENWKMI